MCFSGIRPVLPVVRPVRLRAQPRLDGMLQSVQLRRLDGPLALVVRQASQHVTRWRLWWAKTPIQDAFPESCATSPPQLTETFWC